MSNMLNISCISFGNYGLRIMTVIRSERFPF